MLCFNWGRLLDVSSWRGQCMRWVCMTWVSNQDRGRSLEQQPRETKWRNYGLGIWEKCLGSSQILSSTFPWGLVACFLWSPFSAFFPLPPSLFEAVWVSFLIANRALIWRDYINSMLSVVTSTYRKSDDLFGEYLSTCHILYTRQWEYSGEKDQLCPYGA